MGGSGPLYLSPGSAPSADLIDSHCKTSTLAIRHSTYRALESSSQTQVNSPRQVSAKYHHLYTTVQLQAGVVNCRSRLDLAYDPAPVLVPVVLLPPPPPLWFPLNFRHLPHVYIVSFLHSLNRQSLPHLLPSALDRHKYFDILTSPIDLPMKIIMRLCPCARVSSTFLFHGHESQSRLLSTLSRTHHRGKLARYMQYSSISAQLAER